MRCTQVYAPVLQVCANDPSLALGNSHATDFNDIREYLRRGPLLLGLCYIVWFNNLVRHFTRTGLPKCLKSAAHPRDSCHIMPQHAHMHACTLACTQIMEVGAAIQLMIASIRLCSKTTNITAGNRIEALSTARVAWFIGVQTIRVMIAIVLGIGGTRFLTRTINLEDLIKDLLALQVVAAAGFCPRAYVCACVLRMHARTHARMNERMMVRTHAHACVYACMHACTHHYPCAVPVPHSDVHSRCGRDSVRNLCPSTAEADASHHSSASCLGHQDMPWTRLDCRGKTVDSIWYCLHLNAHLYIDPSRLHAHTHTNSRVYNAVHCSIHTPRSRHMSTHMSIHSHAHILNSTQFYLQSIGIC